MDWTAIIAALPLSLLGVMTTEQWHALTDATDKPTPREVRNILGGTSTLDSIADGYLLVHPTPGSTLEMRLRPDSLVAVIASVDVQGTTDSELDLYTPTWDRVSSQILTDVPVVTTSRHNASRQRPAVEAFYVESDSVTSSTFTQFAQPALIAMHFDAEGHVVATFDPRTFLPDEDWARIRPALRPEPLVLEVGPFNP